MLETIGRLKRARPVNSQLRALFLTRHGRLSVVDFDFINPMRLATLVTLTIGIVLIAAMLLIVIRVRRLPPRPFVLSRWRDFPLWLRALAIFTAINFLHFAILPRPMVATPGAVMCETDATLSDGSIAIPKYRPVSGRTATITSSLYGFLSPPYSSARPGTQIGRAHSKGLA